MDNKESLKEQIDQLPEEKVKKAAKLIAELIAEGREKQGAARDIGKLRDFGGELDAVNIRSSAYE